MSRHLLSYAPIETLVGIDVDRPAIRWASAHLRPGRFLDVPPDPPTGLPAGSFDVVFSVSVFTHLDETAQNAWLSHISELLAPGGLLIASTHPSELTPSLPTLSRRDIETLDREGFVFSSAGTKFNEDVAFHSVAYLDRIWARWFKRVDFTPHGLGNHQDLSVWRAP